MSFKLSIGKTGISTEDMYCNEAIMFFKHNNETTNLFLKYSLEYMEINKDLLHGNIGNGSLNKSSLNKLIINLPSIEDQQKIIKEIDEMEKNRITYFNYGKKLQNLIDGMNIFIKKICDAKEEPVIEDKKQKESDSESEEEEFKWNDKILGKIKKYIDNKDKLKEFRKRYEIPKDVFNKKVEELSIVKKKNKT